MYAAELAPDRIDSPRTTAGGRWQKRHRGAARRHERRRGDAPVGHPPAAIERCRSAALRQRPGVHAGRPCSHEVDRRDRTDRSMAFTHSRRSPASDAIGDAARDRPGEVGRCSRHDAHRVAEQRHDEREPDGDDEELQRRRTDETIVHLMSFGRDEASISGPPPRHCCRPLPAAEPGTSAGRSRQAISVSGPSRARLGLDLARQRTRTRPWCITGIP